MVTVVTSSSRPGGAPTTPKRPPGGRRPLRCGGGPAAPPAPRDWSLAALLRPQRAATRADLADAGLSPTALMATTWTGGGPKTRPRSDRRSSGAALPGCDGVGPRGRQTVAEPVDRNDLDAVAVPVDKAGHSPRPRGGAVDGGGHGGADRRDAIRCHPQRRDPPARDDRR